MSASWSSLGLGVLLSYGALLLLERQVRRASSCDPASRYRIGLTAIIFSAALLCVPLIAQRLPSPALPGTLAQVAPGVARGLAGAGTSGSTAWPGLLPAVAWLWLCAALVAAVRLALAAARLGRSLAQAQSPSAELEREVTALAAELGLAPPAIRLLPKGPPFVTGWLSAQLVLSGELFASLSPTERRLALLHELAHLARGDHRTAALTAALRVLFPLHPAAERLSHELALAREEAVDALVSTESPHAYARLLVDVAERGGSPLSAAMSDHSLQRRVAMLLQPNRIRPAARLGPVLLLGVALLGAGFFSPRVLAQPGPSETERRLRLKVGDRWIGGPFPNLKRIAVGDPGIADIKTLGAGEIEVTGIGEGQTTMLIWLGEGQRLSYIVSIER